MKGITGESFISESLILPQGITVLCDDLGLRMAILASLSTLDESGVAVCQTGSRDPHHKIHILGVPAKVPSLPVRPPASPQRPPATWIRAWVLQTAPPPQVAPRVWRKKGDAGCVAPTGHLFRILPLFRTRPRSVRGQLAGPRRPAPRPRACRGVSVLRHHHHRIHCHRCHHHRRSRRHHHHLGVITPRDTSSNNHSSSNNNNSGRPASRVAGRSRAPSKCSPFFSTSVIIMPTGLNPSLFARASPPSAPKVVPPPPDTMPAGGSGSQQQASAGSGDGEPPTATAASTTATPSSTPSAAVEEVSVAPTPAMGVTWGRVQLYLAAHSGGDGGGF
jgi:hypothetical protein